MSDNRKVTYEEVLDKHGKLVYRNVGTSMMPLLRQNRDLMIIDIHREFGIKDKQIIGILTGIVRDGKTILVTDKKYLFYVHLWCDFFHIRVIILAAKQFAHKVKRSFYE